MEQKTAIGSPAVSELALNDPELKKLLEEHRALDEKLHQFVQRPYLSAMDEIEVRQIKKEKLLRKDRIEAILSRSR